MKTYFSTQSLNLLLWLIVSIGFGPYASSAAPVKSKWLKCGSYKVGLDEAKEVFSLNIGSYTKQGKAVFFPEQIDFADFYGETSNGINKLAFSINRKNLNYQVVNYMKNNYYGKDTGWVQIGKVEEGICMFIKNPTEGNKI